MRRQGQAGSPAAASSWRIFKAPWPTVRFAWFACSSASAEALKAVEQSR
jgi:hypothetical protein